MVCNLTVGRLIQKVAKLGQVGTGPGSRGQLLNFVTPSISKERLKIKMPNLVRGLMARSPIQKVAKSGQLGTGPGSRDLLLNFVTPSISKERLKIKMPNLVRGLMARRPIQKVAKLGQLGGQDPGHMTYF